MSTMAEKVEDEEFIQAFRSGQLDKIRDWLEKKKINLKKKYKVLEEWYRPLTPLGLAVYFGKKEMVQYLIESCGQDVNQRVNGDCTALYVAVDFSHTNLEVVRFLLEHKADPNMESSDFVS